MKCFLMRVSEMLRPDSAAGVLVLSFFDSYGAAAYEKEIPREVHVVFLHFDAKARTAVRFFTDILGSNRDCEKNANFLIIVIVIILTV
ncbi:hypothetical protein [Hungatella effluvii]|nr:hypothetical protein [Hungatella effluvii]